jgi:hypothetical protein
MTSQAETRIASETAAVLSVPSSPGLHPTAEASSGESRWLAWVATSAARNKESDARMRQVGVVVVSAILLGFAIFTSL